MRIDVLLVSEERRTGAFITTLELADELRRRGHDVALNPSAPRDHDLTITHLGDPRSGSVSGPHFMMVHGANPRRRRRLPRYDTIWFPSAALAGWYLNPPNRVVVPPPIDPYDYLTEPGEHVTLSQVSPAKGASRLRMFAQALPHIPFLGVSSNPPKQDLVLDRLPNVTMVPRFEDAREMFALTRLIIMPLGGLSYGRVAVEASVSGIPTIATGLPGVREAMGDSATYVGASFLRNWVSTIDRMYTSEAQYAKASAAAQERGDRVDWNADMGAMVAAVEGTV